MAMTELVLLWMGSVALLATYGVFYEFRDRWTSLLVEFAAAILWGFFSLSSMDVIVPSGASTPVSEPVYPVMFVGIGFALVTFLYAMYDLVAGVSKEAQEADLEGMGGAR